MSAGRVYVTGDHLGSTRLLTDGNGVEVERRDYLPFGQEWPGETVSATTVKFTGKERDAETGLDFFGARYFSAAQGRFTSPDRPFADQKVADPQSWNLYSYTRNNPLRYVDVDGRVRRDANGQIIFTPQGKVDRNFTNGDTRKGQMQPGFIQADNGKKIQAYEQVGGSSAYKCDCHGLTFGDGKYWINNDQVSGLLIDYRVI